MRLQYFNGGLANQVFQYIFYRYGELATGETDWFLDDSFFYFKNEHNGYELENVFGLKPKLLSQQFDSDVWQEIIELRKTGIGTAQIFSDMGMDTVMIAETNNYVDFNRFNGKIYQIPANEYHPEILQLPGEVVYYFGYWIKRNWLDEFGDILRKELSFPEITETHNIKFSEQIKNTNSAGIHIRCGDFISLGWNLSPDYYKEQIELVKKEIKNPHYFIFTDDLNWVDMKKSELGLQDLDITFIEGNNTDALNYRDLQLLSQCKGIIMSNSSFCYLAALLNTNLEWSINPVPYRNV